MNVDSNNNSNKIDIEVLIDEMQYAIEEGFKFRLLKRAIINDEKVLALIEQMKSNLPSVIMQARDIVADRNKIIDSAKASADKTVSRANTQAENIVAKANEEARQIIENAKTEAQYLVSQTKILQDAQAKAAELDARSQAECDALIAAAHGESDRVRSEAADWSNNVRTSAYNYALDVFNKVGAFFDNSGASLDEAMKWLDSVK